MPERVVKLFVEATRTGSLLERTDVWGLFHGTWFYDRGHIHLQKKVFLPSTQGLLERYTLYCILEVSW
jgi:hypothetical protein